MSGQGDTYLEYTKQWIELVNRGNLFNVSDETFRFFHDLEIKVCAYLKDIFLAGGQADQSTVEIISSIVEDADVQFSWLLLCLDLDDEELSNEECGRNVFNDSWIFNGQYLDGILQAI